MNNHESAIVLVLIILIIWWFWNRAQNDGTERFIVNEWDYYKFGMTNQDYLNQWNNENQYLPSCDTCQDGLCHKKYEPGQECIHTRGPLTGVVSRCGTFPNNTVVMQNDPNYCDFNDKTRAAFNILPKNA